MYTTIVITASLIFVCAIGLFYCYYYPACVKRCSKARIRRGSQQQQQQQTDVERVAANCTALGRQECRDIVRELQRPPQETPQPSPREPTQPPPAEIILRVQLPSRPDHFPAEGRSWRRDQQDPPPAYREDPPPSYEEAVRWGTDKWR